MLHTANRPGQRAFRRHWSFFIQLDRSEYAKRRHAPGFARRRQKSWRVALALGSRGRLSLAFASCGAARRVTRRKFLRRYFVITPQAMRSPALPAGSVFWSSALACTTIAVPPLLYSEWLSLPRLTSLSSRLKCALPSAPTVKLGPSPAWCPSGFSNPCFFPSGLKCGPADLKSGASHFAF